ncbi:hypothetical protein LTR62_004121 [Meristemomyces frigidus]|uniref:Uncharacterized protein n=1 Tax=Meristemomyces frigidus TaxID=1508187 RepID=A0AAN7TRJ3_9PEZI|nr:hypothetical protein LTR62_004121 [Meristemomyces frigidus]
MGHPAATDTNSISAVVHSQAPLRSIAATSNELTGVPLRHPRPLTAAELYLECEKEQEAVVNRLTRELTALRAQSASVASNASHSSTSTSASLLPIDISDPNPTHQMTGATHPTPSRRHRSSSSVSTRSIPTPSTSISGTGSGIASTHAQAGSTTTVPIGAQSQASADRAAAAGSSLSRQPSVSASGASTPARQSLDIARHGGPTPVSLYTLPYRPSLSRETSHASTQALAGIPIPHTQPSPAQSPGASVHSAMQHYADTAAYRTEMEIVKAENDMLRQRVRALERALHTRRRDSSQSDVARSELLNRPHSTTGGLASPAGVAVWAGGVGGVAGPRERSESQSTTASSRRGPAMDEEVKVGESAQSAGIGRG